MEDLIPIKTVRRIAWLKQRRRTWQAAISLGEVHATIEPKISECETHICRKASQRRELKHLSTGRKRKQIVIPPLAASEKGTGQTESTFEKKLEMW